MQNKWSNPPSLSLNVFGDLMWPIIWLLKMSGHSPLSYVYNKNNAESMEKSRSSISSIGSEMDTGIGVENRREIKDGFPSPSTHREYRIRFRSLTLLWSVLCAIWMLVSWNYNLFSYIRLLRINNGNNDTLDGQPIGTPSDEVVHPHTKSRLDPEAIIIMKCMGIWQVVSQCTELFLAWAESGTLAKFLNEWAPLQHQFQNIFPFVSTVGAQYEAVKRTRNLLFLFYVATPALLLLPPFLLTSGVDGFFLKAIIVFPYVWQISFIALMEDVKVIVTYRILAAAFGQISSVKNQSGLVIQMPLKAINICLIQKGEAQNDRNLSLFADATFVQIREGIMYDLKWNKVTVKHVKNWRSLAYSVRLQVSRAGESQKSHQLLLIGGSTFLITSSIFMMLHSSWNVPHNEVWITFGILFISLQIGRLYLKILAANLIPYEDEFEESRPCIVYVISLFQENLIARELFLMEFNEGDLELKLEVILFHDMIMEKPICVSFGDYIKFNKKLLLGIGSQVVTYLIVLLQFTNKI